jgi:broad specificity phosphatase PhoE
MIRRRTALQTAAVAMMMATAPAAQAPIETTVVLVRHAEILPDGSADPVLAESGIARATTLAEVLKDAGVKAILTTHYKRTIMTGEPLSALVKAPLVPMGIKGGPAGLDAHVREVVQNVHATYTGGTVVIIGHGNTLPALVKALSGIDIGAIAHDAHDGLFVVTTIAPGRGRLVRARYGR